jgi:SAM-dependent methyltransferase
MDHDNIYRDRERASAYAGLGLAGTYHLAYRDLPDLLARHASGRRALDFGCGAGRSTRFLAALGFEVSGVDIAAEMIEHARAADPAGDYRLIDPADGLSPLPEAGFDLVLAAFPFDNIPQPHKPAVLEQIVERLAPQGLFVNLVSAPELYLHEWLSFSTRAFVDNRSAVSGDPVRIVITDFADARPFEDVLCSDDDYRDLYTAAGLELITTHRPLGRGDEPQAWVNEERIAPWTIYLLRRAARIR